MQRVFRAVIVFGCALIAGHVALVVGLRDNPPLRAALSSLFLVLGGGAAAGALFYAARRSAPYGRRASLAWATLATAQLANVLGVVTRLIVEAGFLRPPFSSPADGFYLTSYLLFATGILRPPFSSPADGFYLTSYLLFATGILFLLMYPPLDRLERLKTLLDMGIAAITAVLSFWAVLTIALALATQASLLSLLLATVYTILDFTLFFALFALLSFRFWSPQRAVLLLLMSGFAGRGLALILIAIQKSASGGSLADTAYLASYLLFGLTGVLQATRPLPDSTRQPAGDQERKQVRWMLYTPYLWIVVACILLLRHHALPVSLPLEAIEWGIVATIGLVVVRQILVLHENMQLYAAARQELRRRQQVENVLREVQSQLELKVQERTADLARANLMLQTEMLERERTQEEIRKLKEFHEGLVQDMAEGVVVQDAQGYFTFVNPAAAAMLGYTPEEMIGQHWTLVVPPDQQSIIRAADERRAHHQADRYKADLVRKDGTRVPGLIAGRPRFEGEQFAGTLTVFTDITELEQAQAALRDQITALQVLTELDREIIATTEPSEVLESVCRHAAELVHAPKSFIAIEVASGQMRLVASYGLEEAALAVEEFARCWPTSPFHPEALRTHGMIEHSDLPLDDPCMPAFRAREAIRARVIVPFSNSERTLGALVVLDTAPRVWKANELHWLHSLATEAAVALDKARLFEAERQQREFAETLREVGAALTSTLRIETILDCLLEQVGRVVPNDAANIMLIEGDHVNIVRWRGYERFGAQDFIATVHFPVTATPTLQQMLETGQPVIIPDTADHADWVHVPEMEWLRSYLAVPIRIRSEVIGFLNVDSATPGFFGPAQAGRLRAFADQAALALENARLFEAANERALYLTTLNEIGQAITSTLDLDRVLNTLLESVRQVTGAEACSAALLDPEQGDLVFCHAVGAASQAVIGLRLKSGQGIAGWVAAHQQSLLVPEAHADSRFYGDVSADFITRDVVCVPLLAHDNIIGVLELLNKRHGRFDLDDVQLLEAVAAQAAVAIENARLFEETRRHAQDTAMLNAVIRAMVVSPGLEALFHSVAGELSRLIPFDRLSLALLDKEHQTFTVMTLAETAPPSLAKSITMCVQDTAASEDILHGRTHITDDLSAETVFPAERLLHRAGLRSRVNVPLMRAGQVLGALNVASTRPAAFGRREIALLEQISGPLAIAIENTRLFEETRRRLEEQAIISEVALAGATGQSFDETVAYATRALGQLWPEAAIGFMFVDETDRSLRFHPSTRGMPPELVAGFRVPLDQGIAGWVVRERQPARVGNAQADPRYLMALPDIRSEMGAPLVVGERVIGVVDVQSYRPEAFTEDDLRLLETLARQLATIFEKTRLDAALARYTEFLEQRVDERTAELRAVNEALVKALRVKDEFLATMSHELRTPLNAILGLSEALQELVYGPLTEKQLDSLRIIHESGHHLLTLINDILDLSKIEAGAIELNLMPVEIEPICQASLQFVRQPALKKQLQVALTVHSPVKTIQTDGRRLKQILVNLLSNAVKFTPAGGSVGLEVSSDAERQAIHFTVWDTGIGIAPEDMDRLFRPFVQLDSSLARQYTGTGLGLALVKRLTEMLGGEVAVVSQVGKGSRFTVTLPWSVERGAWSVERGAWSGERGAGSGERGAEQEARRYSCRLHPAGRG